MSLSSRRARKILARLVAAQEGLCCYCERTFAQAGDRQATIEHKKAKSDGGSDRLTNLAAACLHCNRHRGKQKQQARHAARARVAPPASATA